MGITITCLLLCFHFDSKTISKSTHTLSLARGVFKYALVSFTTMTMVYCEKAKACKNLEKILKAKNSKGLQL